ncbi:MAG: hypothetical protein ACRC33_20385 [Gemmataceae bacterium]
MTHHLPRAGVLTATTLLAFFAAGCGTGPLGPLPPDTYLVSVPGMH